MNCSNILRRLGVWFPKLIKRFGPAPASCRIAIAFLCLAAFGACSLAAAEKNLPGDLLNYVHEAQKLGLKDPEIRNNAMKAGWIQADVDRAIAASHARPSDPANAAKGPAPSEASSSAAAEPAPVAAAAGPASEPIDGYRIGAGDVLQIIVWKDPDTSVPAATVRPDGKIAMPLLKEVSVIGQTPKQAEQMITEQLRQFIRGADVTLVVKEINSTKAYVVGAVRKEGPISLRYHMTILQAISEAGGLTDYAKRKKIYLLRSENGKQFRFPFNYNAVIKGEQIEQNIPVIPGDTIVIPH